MLKHYIIFIFCLIIITININAQEFDFLSKLNIDIQNFKKDNDLLNASIGIYAVDINSGIVLTDINSDLSLVPASTLKIITTSAALEIFGKDYRFETTVQYDGIIDSSGILWGNIYIKGGGDPTLGSKMFNKYYYEPFFIDQWTEAIKNLGIKTISGSIIGDSQIFGEEYIQDTWIWGDIGNYYGPCISGLSIFDNEYEVIVKPGLKTGDSTTILRINPELKGIKFYNKLVTSTYDNSNIFGSLYDDKRYITGTIPIKNNEYVIKGSLPNPTLLAAQSLNDNLIKHGVFIAQAPTTSTSNDYINLKNNRKNIFITYSPTLEEILYYTNTYSMNLYAEALLKQIGLNYDKNNKSESNVSKLIRFWNSKGIDTKGLFLNDGCGLSRYSGVTARQLVDILVYMKTKSKYFDSFYNSLPIAGKSGSLKHMCNNSSAEGNIHAKTGYITRVRSYTGYVKTKSGKDVAFAIMVNNFSCSPAEMKNKIEKIMIDFSELSF